MNKQKDDIIVFDDQKQPDEIPVIDEAAISERITVLENGKLRIQLEFPFTYATQVAGGERKNHEVPHIECRRMNAGDMQAAMKVRDEFEQSMIMFQRSSGLSKEVIALIDLSDMQFAFGAIEGFFLKSPGTGKQQSPPSQ